MASGAQNAIRELHCGVSEVNNGAVLLGLHPKPLSVVVVVGKIEIAENAIGAAQDLEPAEPIHQYGDGTCGPSNIVSSNSKHGRSGLSTLTKICAKSVQSPTVSEYLGGCSSNLLLPLLLTCM